MPQDKVSDSGKFLDNEVYKNIILLSLPWLSLQRDMLAIGKQGIQDYSHVSPLQNFTLREIHALMMMLDPSGTWRDSHRELEARLKESSTQSISKFMSGLSALLESQEAFLTSAIETLNAWRNGNKRRAN
jgi:hypothetical protein